MVQSKDVAPEGKCADKVALEREVIMLSSMSTQKVRDGLWYAKHPDWLILGEGSTREEAILDFERTLTKELKEILGLLEQYNHELLEEIEGYNTRP